jgi:hypothetical protein
MLKQKGLVDFVGNMVVTGQIADPIQLEIIDQFDEEELKEDLKNCSHIFEAQKIFKEKKESLILSI